MDLVIKRRTSKVIRRVCQLISLDWDKGATSYELRSAFEELLHKYKVDLYLSGHVHAYERMFPVYDERVDPQTISHCMELKLWLTFY